MGRFRLDISENFFTKRAVKPLNRLDEEVVESQSLEVSQRWGCGLVVALTGA